MKPYSEACVRNREPILAVLQDVYAQVHTVLEIGSGSGQHAVYFARALPHLLWQTSDLAENHAGIQLWIDESGLANVRSPIALDVDAGAWPKLAVDAAFTANTLHIISWASVRNLFARVGPLLSSGAPLCIYGPFNYAGAFTSDSNAAFDAMLRRHDPNSAIRDFESVCKLAAENGLALKADHAMPANNRLLVFRAGKTA